VSTFVVLYAFGTPTASGAPHTPGAHESDSASSTLVDGGVRYYDIAADAGITWRRTASASEALAAALRTQPLFTISDLIFTPDSPRGMPGVAIFDYDDDGDLDIYATNGPGTPNSLYANQLVESGHVVFIDRAAAAGVTATAQDSLGVCYGDLDNDGDQDLMVLGNLGVNLLYENQGQGTFVDITVAAGIAGDVYTSPSCSMGDVDGDGLLDIVVANSFDQLHRFATIAVPYAENFPNQLYKNLGPGGDGHVDLLDVSATSGILEVYLPDPVAPFLPLPMPGDGTITWGITLVDIDLDGDVDLLQADDQGAILSAAAGFVDRGYNQLFINDGTGHFTNVTLQAGLDRVGDWMGLAFGDFNHDGLLDFFSTNFGNHSTVAFLNSPIIEPRDSRWFLQQPDGSFHDSLDDGSPHTPFGWGTSAIDYDNDGDSDIVFHGGFDLGLMLATSPAVLLANDGAANFSRDAAAFSTGADHVRRNVRGMAVGDLDGNGFADVVSVSNYDYPDPIALDPIPFTLGSEFDADAYVIWTFDPVDPNAFVFDTDYTWKGLEFPDGTMTVELSTGNDNHWTQVELLGTVGITTGGQANRNGIGSVVRFTPDGGQPVLQPVLGGSSKASQDSLVAGFGLGSATAGVADVLWAGGTHNRFYLRAGEQVVVPEIPCNFDDPDGSLANYAQCVTQALNELRAAGAISANRRGELQGQAMRAWNDVH
jgi:hypothetical protein